MATRKINTFIEHLMNEAMTAAGTAGGGKGNDGGGFVIPNQYNNPDGGGYTTPKPYGPDGSDDFVGPPGYLAPRRPSMFDPRPGRRPLDGVGTPGGNANPNRPGGFRPPMIKPDPRRPFRPPMIKPDPRPFRPGPLEKKPRGGPKPPLPPLGG